MRKRNKTILLFMILFLALMPVFTYAANGEEKDKGRALEIVYPRIPGYTTEKVVFSGLPEYVDYIFRFSVIIIGLIVLGVLIYSGIQYLTSAGNPEKLKNAKQGIFSAFLGAIILLSAYLIFNTINPELTILEPPEPKIIEPTVEPGIYICTYDIGDINSIIERYKSEDRETKIKAAEELKNIMKSDKGICYIARYSDRSFVFKPKQHTAFTIPRKEYIYVPATEDKPAETKIKWEYDYGIILHQKDNWRGRCKLAGLYENKIDPHPNLVGFDEARSITFFRKLEPEEEPTSDNRGVILYQCLNYNDGTLCPKNGKVTSPDDKFFPISPPGDNLTLVTEKKLGKLAAPPKGIPTYGTRSVQIDPLGSYFAIMFSEDNFTGDVCEVITTNDNNLLDRDIGRCDAPGVYTPCKSIFADEPNEQLVRCEPCLKSMYVVKGKVIGY